MTETPAPSSPPPASAWLLRIPEIFSRMAPEILARLGATPVRTLGTEYYLARLEDPGALRSNPAGMFVRWNLPVHHGWPCRPRETEGFIEKAAQALAAKFGPFRPQTVLTGRLDSSLPRSPYKALASNLRGRLLQVFPLPPSPPDAEGQNPRRETLFCLTGREGLFCGLSTPRDANGYYPGGSKYIVASGSAVSRAGAKIAEALHYLSLHRAVPLKGCHWLELGASPGGMTAELLAAGCRVTAVDRAPLDRSLDRARGLEFIVGDAGEFEPPPGAAYDAILSDLNGSAVESMRKVARQSRLLKPGGLVVFTMKTAGAESVVEMLDLRRAVALIAESAGLVPVAATHLTVNRREFTLFFSKGAGAAKGTDRPRQTREAPFRSGGDKGGRKGRD